MSKFMGILAAAGIALAALPGLAAAHEHEVTAEALGIQLAQGSNRSANCLAQRQACISAGTQTGTYGARYVLPEVVRQCYESYRACINQR